MICNSFCHLPGIAVTTEQCLWSAGLTTWEHALSCTIALHSSIRRPSREDLQESIRRYGLGDAVWFAARLPSAQAWRLFGDFRANCAYLDVETTGMSSSSTVTTVVLYDGRSIRTYVRGRNLDAFQRDIEAYKLLVTYNGKSFDLPVLRRDLGCRFDQAHLDLRYVLAGLGVRGGLKACERQLSITRPGMEEIDGYLAVLLWRQYQRAKDERALETLLAYNVQDAVNLEALAVHAYNANLERLAGAPFVANYRLPLPLLAANPFTPDPDTVQRLLYDRGGSLTISGRMT